MQEIEAIWYNLNISRYVSTAQEEVQIDLKGSAPGTHEYRATNRRCQGTAQCVFNRVGCISIGWQWLRQLIFKLPRQIHFIPGTSAATFPEWNQCTHLQ